MFVHCLDIQPVFRNQKKNTYYCLDYYSKAKYKKNNVAACRARRRATSTRPVAFVNFYNKILNGYFISLGSPNVLICEETFFLVFSYITSLIGRFVQRIDL